MDDDRVWSAERDLWVGDSVLYENAIDDECLMVLPSPPFIVTGGDAIAAVKNTPRWENVEFSERRIGRPHEGLLVAAYKVNASDSKSAAFEAYCTTTYRRLGTENWRVVSHHQTPAD